MYRCGTSMCAACILQMSECVLCVLGVMGVARGTAGPRGFPSTSVTTQHPIIGHPTPAWKLLSMHSTNINFVGFA